jgi:serine/threonine protein kinase
LIRAKIGAVSDAGQPSFVAGATIAGRFRLERALGEGGMGLVWAAVHTITRKPVALKFLKRSASAAPGAVERFLREARAACAVRHPSIVDVHDVFLLEDGSPVMVMDLLTGETFADRLAGGGAMPLADVASIMVHVCAAVACAHALGIVHRDLKPENIFLARTYRGMEVKVLDFGIAKLTSFEGDAAHTGGTTGTGDILGTPFYMAPEQLFGEKDVDHRADIWALGIILYEALVGTLPTRADNIGQIVKIVTTSGIPPIGERVPDLPAPVVELVTRMLSRDRAQRPADVGEVLSTLSAYTDEPFFPSDAPSNPGPSPSDPLRRNDPAHASTVDAGALAVGPPAVVAIPKPTRRIGAIAAFLVAVGLVGAGGIVAWRASLGTQTQAGVAPASVSVATPNPVLVLPQPSKAPPDEPSAVPSSFAASAPDLRPPANVGTGTAPPLTKQDAAPASVKSSASASAAPSSRRGDPGSYW